MAYLTLLNVKTPRATWTWWNDQNQSQPNTTQVSEDMAHPVDMAWLRPRAELACLWHDVLWSDEVDVVALGLDLQLEHEVGDLLRAQLPSLLPLTDVPVLTKDAPQVAQAEEYRAGTVPALHGFQSSYHQRSDNPPNLATIKTGGTVNLPEHLGN